jgi:hypothetical protein
MVQDNNSYILNNYIPGISQSSAFQHLNHSIYDICEVACKPIPLKYEAYTKILIFLHL